jgi:hypothetical protein
MELVLRAVRGEGVARRARAAWLELVQAIFARVGGDAFDRAVEARDAEYVAGLRATVAVTVECLGIASCRGKLTLTASCHQAASSASQDVRSHRKRSKQCDGRVERGTPRQRSHPSAESSSLGRARTPLGRALITPRQSPSHHSIPRVRHTRRQSGEEKPALRGGAEGSHPGR